MAQPMPPDATKEIEFVKGLVARHFPVYDVKVAHDVIQFFCRIDETVLEDSFERLREEMSPHGYIPMVTYEQGEHIVMVGRKPPAKYKSVRVNLAMLIITLIATTVAGVFQWAGYADVPWSEMFYPETVLTGILVFALPLMAILSVHELGHYFMARRRNVAASLPFFIPSIPPLGTFGAFISLRDPIPNRKSLLEIGVAGPLAGLAVALPMAVLGLVLTNMEARPVPEDLASGTLTYMSLPLIYQWLMELVPLEGEYLMHPTMFAAWVGFLVTALNLLPAGQLDGGHIARALLGSSAKYASWAAIAVLIGLSFFYLPWLLFAVLILILGSRHPPPLNDITKLDVKRKLVGVFAFVVLVLAFVPVPITIVVTDCSFTMTPQDDTNRTTVPGQPELFTVLVESTGNTKYNITFEEVSSPSGWEVAFTDGETVCAESYRTTLNASGSLVLTVLVIPSPSSEPGNHSVTVGGDSSAGEATFSRTVTFNLTVELPGVELRTGDDAYEVARGSSAVLELGVNNSGQSDLDIVLSARDLPGYVTVVLYEGDVADGDASWNLNVTVPAQDGVTVSVLVLVWPSAEPGEKEFAIDAHYQGIVVASAVMTVTVH